MTQHESNLGTTERWLSLLGGIGLLVTTGRGGAIGRMARGALGLSLLARGASGYCMVKAALGDRVPRVAAPRRRALDRRGRQPVHLRLRGLVPSPDEQHRGR